MKRAFTLIEVLVVVAIVATIAALLLPSIMVAGVATGEQDRATFMLRTVTHDGHMWVIESSLSPHHFVHHPDCHCLTGKAERLDK